MKERALDELDTILALVGSIFSLTLTIWIALVIEHSIYIMIGIICFVVCIGYMIIKRFFNQSLIPYLNELIGSNRFYITLNIIFFILLSYSIISIYLRPDLYVRPIGYFVSIALMTVIVANEILFLSPNESKNYFALCKIIIIGLSLLYSQILIFPNIVGGDPWWHRWFTLKIIDKGYIPEGLDYSKLPLMHLIIGMTSLVTDLNYKMATMFSISSLQIICDALFVFLLGKFLINTKIGLLAALLLEVANLHIKFSYATIPNTLAATLILPIIFVLLKVRRENPFIGNSVIIFLMGILILTHPVTSMCVAILLFIFWLSFEVYTRLFHPETYHSVTWPICILYSTGMLAYWTYISGHLMTLSNMIKLGFSDVRIELGYLYLSDFPSSEQIFKYLGLFLFFSISFIGFFYMISKKFRNINRFITSIGGMAILCITFFALLVKKYIIYGRWQYFSQILMVIPLSLSLFIIVGIFRNNLIKILFMSISVFILSFLLIMSPMTNIDNHLFSPKSGIRYAFTESELYALDTLSEILNGPIYSDGLYNIPFKYQIKRDLKFVCIDDLLYIGDFSNLQDKAIIIREEILKHSYGTGYRIVIIKYDLTLKLSQQKFNCIYNCGSVSGYLKP